MGIRPNRDNVYTFENVKFDVGGREFLVSRIRINLVEGSVPDVRVVVDPAHVPGDPVVPATAATLSTLAQFNEELQILAIEKAKSNLSFEIHRKGELDHKIELKDWICQASGITSAGASGSFANEVQIVHPLERADESTTLLTGYTERDAEFPIKETKKYKDPIDAIVQVLRKLKDFKRANLEDDVVARVEPNICTKDQLGDYKVKKIEQALNDSFGRAADIIEKHLEWDKFDGKYADWPLPKCFEDELLEGLKNSMPNYVLSNDISPIEAIKQSIGSDFGATLIPLFTEEKLKMRPYTPWADVSILIYDDEISDLNFPGADAAPIGGIMISKSATAQGGYTSLHGKGVHKRKLTSVFGYIPKKVQDEPEKSGGRFVPLRVPSWISSLAIREAGSLGKDTNPQTAETKGSMTTPANNSYGTLQPNEDHNKYSASQDLVDSAVVVLAHQYFLSMFRGQVQTSLRTKLMIKTPNSQAPEQLICPGYVCRILSRSNTNTYSAVVPPDKPLYDFYITNVEHVIDVQSAQCYTTIGGRHCRPPGGIPDMAENDTLNPVWLQQ